jgi:hypothetical protein
MTLQVLLVQDFENVREDNQKAGNKKDQPNSRDREKDPPKQDAKRQSETNPYEQDQRAHISFLLHQRRTFFSWSSWDELEESNGTAEQSQGFHKMQWACAS